MDFHLFLRKLGKLNVDRSKGEPAPHKAVLLHTILQLLDEGCLRDNRVYISAELVTRFKENWVRLVSSNRFQPNFALPFYHLKSDGFWQLRTYPGREILLSSSHSIKSFAALRQAVAYGSFDTDVYQQLEVRNNRELAHEVLLRTYFPNGITGKKYDLFQEIEGQILHEPASEYQRQVSQADDEEIFVRGGVFKKVIPKAYHFACCITGFSITAVRDVQMVDACHIVPFNLSHDDTIRNGLSLSPTFHRAFDRFLISTDSDYRVVVSGDFTEAGNHSIREFAGKQIFLPDRLEYRPSVENLEWHYRRFKEMR